MGFFANIDPEAYDRQYSDRQLLAGMWSYFRPYERRLLIIAALLVVIAVAGAALPLVVARGLDVIESDPSAARIGLLSALVLASGVITWAANWGRRRLTTRVLGDAVLSLRGDAFSAAAGHDLSFYDKHSSGRIVSRITTDTKDFGDVILLVTDVLSQFVQALILAAILFTIDVRLTLYLFALLPLIFLTATSLRRLTRRVTRQRHAGDGVGQRHHQGNCQRHRRRQELPPGSDDLRRVRCRQPAVLPSQCAAGRGPGLCLPGPQCPGGRRDGAASVCGWPQRHCQGMVTAGAWFLFITSLDRFFFPVLNLSAFWAPGAGGPVGGRAYLRLNRGRAGGGADRRQAAACPGG